LEAGIEEVKIEEGGSPSGRYLGRTEDLKREIDYI
jgi:hypothetical protein